MIREFFADLCQLFVPPERRPELTVRDAETWAAYHEPHIVFANTLTGRQIGILSAASNNGITHHILPDDRSVFCDCVASKAFRVGLCQETVLLAGMGMMTFGLPNQQLCDILPELAKTPAKAPVTGGKGINLTM